MDEQEEGSVACTISIKRKIKNIPNLIAIHTHPASMSPSAENFNACFKYKYKVGYVAIHDGKVFGYTANEKISRILYDLYLGNFMDYGYDAYEAQILTLDKLKKRYNIDCWEV